MGFLATQAEWAMPGCAEICSCKVGQSTIFYVDTLEQRICQRFYLINFDNILCSCQALLHSPMSPHWPSNFLARKLGLMMVSSQRAPSLSTNG